MDVIQQYWYLVVPFLGALWYVFAKIGSGERAYPYQKKPAVMTRNEQQFYHALLKAVGSDFDVFGMVRIADLLEVEKGVAKRQSWQNRINCKHVDFVLCDPNTQEAILAIEVDDRSHERRDRKERDYFVDRAFAAANLPLLRVQATRTYSAKSLRVAVTNELKAKRSKKLPSERRVTAQ